MSRSKEAAQERLFKALRPGVAALREFNKVGGSQFALTPVKRAFRGFNLNPNEPMDWQILAGVLAIHLFDEGKKEGRPPEWGSARWLGLLQQVHQRKWKNSHLEESQVCKFIARDKSSPDYVGPESKGAGLVKQLRKAQRGISTKWVSACKLSACF